MESAAKLRPRPLSPGMIVLVGLGIVAMIIVAAILLIPILAPLFGGSAGSPVADVLCTDADGKATVCLKDVPPVREMKPAFDEGQPK